MGWGKETIPANACWPSNDPTGGTNPSTTTVAGPEHPSCLSRAKAFGPGTGRGPISNITNANSFRTDLRGNNNALRFSSRTPGRLHDGAAGQLLLSQGRGGGVAVPEGLLAASDDDHGRVDHGPGGGAQQQHGADADQVPARVAPVPLRRLREGADGVDPPERRRPVRPRLLCHIISETVFPGYPEVSRTAGRAAVLFERAKPV